MHMLGHEVRAPQSCSLAERAALGREVQAAQHRALRLHVRLAPQDGALACAPARRELGKWVIGPTGAARVGRGGVNRSRQTRFRQGFLATEDDPRRVYPGRRPHWGSPMCTSHSAQRLSGRVGCSGVFVTVWRPGRPGCWRARSRVRGTRMLHVWSLSGRWVMGIGVGHEGVRLRSLVVSAAPRLGGRLAVCDIHREQSGNYHS